MLLKSIFFETRWPRSAFEGKAAICAEMILILSKLRFGRLNALDSPGENESLNA
jgi:hypothetical protein